MQPQDPFTPEQIDQLPLIEVHCHSRLSPTDAFLSELIELQQRERLSYVLLIIDDTPSHWEAVRNGRERMGALLWVDPTKEGWLAAAERATVANRDILRGYKLHPTIGGFDVTPELLRGLFALANREKLLVVTHTDNERSQAGGYRPLLEEYPETKLILYHASPADEAFALVKQYPNVYIDVSYLAWGREFQQEALRRVGKEKILFGIDSPLGFSQKEGHLEPHYRRAAREVAGFYDGERETVECVLYRNAARLLRLPVG